MEINDLIEFGMTKTEAKIYLELLKIGENSIGHIIKRTGLHRGTVYNSLTNLIKKGFVSFIDKERVRYYKVSGEKIFVTFVENKKRILDEEKNRVNDLFNKFKLINENKEDQKVEVFYGTESFKTLFIEIYNECNKSNCEYLFQGRDVEMQNFLGEAYYKYAQELRKKMKIKCRMILDQKNINHPYKKDVHEDIRYFPTNLQSPVNYWIYEDVVLIVLFKTIPLTIIKIKSQILANSFRNYFENLWNFPFKFSGREIGVTQLTYLLRSAKELNILYKSRTAPFFLYPHNEKKFLKYRKSREKRFKTMSGKYDINIFREELKLFKKNLPIRYIIGKDALDLFFNIINEEFGDIELRKRVNEIKKNLKKYNVKIKIIDEFNPLTMFTSDKQFQIIFPSEVDVYGFITSQSSIREVFSKLFEEYWNRAKPIENYLEKI